MPQQGYGRNVKAQSDYGATQRAYQYSPRAAQDYLSGDALVAYESARKEAFTPFLPGQGFRAHQPQINARESAFNRMEKLRDIAGVNALGDFTKQAGKLSKPWKLQASQGFLTEPEQSREEPVMTAHPDKMGDPNNPGSYAARRQALTTRQYNPDEAFTLIKDDDRRLKLKAQFEASRMGLGSNPSMSNLPMSNRTSSGISQYIRSLMGAQAKQEDPERAYAGY